MQSTFILRVAITAALLGGFCAPRAFCRDDRYDAWLRYARLTRAERSRYEALPPHVTVLSESPVMDSAKSEWIRGVQEMLGQTQRSATGLAKQNSIILGTLADLKSLAPELLVPASLRADGFWLMARRFRAHDCIFVVGGTDRGVLYGVFALLRKLALGEDLAHLRELQEPAAPVRWVNQWDNLDGSIERGYGGPSIFFADGSGRADLSRASQYARLLASVGINGCVVNNVNADPRMLAADFLPQLARIAEAFRPWGVRLGVSVDFSSPKALGELATFDPLDPRVSEWWKNRADEIYRVIPDFGGFLVKADSEGRPGPSSYGRSPAEAANGIARALRPHGGIVFYRAFVYNHHLDWRDPKSDRARAAYDIFHPLDGKFDDNVIIQVKHGPIDFQVREPLSPLFGGLEDSNQAMELQITQEYTGQQRHLCFLVPMWKEVLDFDLRAEGRSTPVKEIVSGKSFHRQLGGFAGVANVGLNPYWLRNPLAMANLYGFGRLAWDPNLLAPTIIHEWTRLSFGNDALTVKTIDQMQLASWRTYEDYTGPLGAGTLTDILGSHYGPGVASSENNGWGQWHRADHDGIGMDRTVTTGTGFVGQYSSEVQKIYETAGATPDELVLFFHHLPYSYVLHSGQTIIQSIYDSHFAGVERVRASLRQWQSLREHLDRETFSLVLAQLQYQLGHATVWRDAICTWFLRTSGIPDAQGRVGHDANRIEVQSMHLQGYLPVDVEPVEVASQGKAVVCRPPALTCTASFTFGRVAGCYAFDVQYFDQNNGKSRFRLLVGDRVVDTWIAEDDLPSSQLGGDTSTRRHIGTLELHPGDQIRIEGAPDGGELAALDYVEIYFQRNSP
jgi:alpha-glucuronidase